MKKRIALLLVVLVACTAMFAACSKTPTTRSVRWAENETYTYNISLADFKTGDGNETSFATYEHGGKTYMKDTMISSQELNSISDAKELRPVDVKGTFVMTISSPNSTTTKFSTEQVMYSQYDTSKLNELKCLDVLKDCVIAPDSEENPFANNNGRTTLKSVMTTWVTFDCEDSETKQTPIASFTENKGFYIGKEAQEISNYKYEATYDFDKRVVSVKVNDGEAVERKLNLKKGATCIDANQLLLYVRSMDKSSAAFSDSPSVSVYSVVSNSLATATFGLTREFNAVLRNGDSDHYAVVNCVAVAVGGTPFMTQLNLPDISGVGDGYDCLMGVGASKVCKYSTIKFRAGWNSYELAQYDANVLEAIKPTAK